MNASDQSTRNKNQRMGLMIAGVVLAMLVLTAVSPILYNLFCRVTGFGGTTQVALAAPGAAEELPKIEVVFNARKGGPLRWDVKPEERRVTATPGEATRVNYLAQNEVAVATTGTSLFNVTPQKVGKYFSKIECFCFQEQTLNVGELREMPLTFFVDPAMFEDPDTRDVRSITLSYTFYPVYDR